MSENRSDGPARSGRAKKTRFFCPWRRIGAEINCLGALPDAQGHPKKASFFHRDIFWDSPGTPGTQKEAIPLTLEDHLDPGRFPGAIFDDFGWILDAPGASRERFRDDFGKDYATFLPNATNPRSYVLYATRGTKSLNTVMNVQGPPVKAFSILASASAIVPRLRNLPLRAVAACCLLLATSRNVPPQNSRIGPRKFQERCCLQPATGPYYFLLATCCLLPAACNLLLSTLLDGTIPRSGLLHLVCIYIY